jgi:hypothetical protein
VRPLHFTHQTLLVAPPLYSLHRFLCTTNSGCKCEFNFYSRFTFHLSSLTTSHLTSHISHLTSHISHLTSHISHLTSHISHLTSHISHLTSHNSHNPHISHCTLHISLTSHNTHISQHSHRPPTGHLWNTAEYIKSEAKTENSAVLSTSIQNIMEVETDDNNFLSLFFVPTTITLHTPVLTLNYLYLMLFHQLQSLCCDTRMEVRHGAIITFFKTLKLYGGLLVPRAWSLCLWRLVLPLLWRVQVGEFFSSILLLSLTFFIFFSSFFSFFIYLIFFISFSHLISSL